MVDVFCESSKCLGCANPRCRSACPVGYDIPAFLRSVADGNFDEAVELVGHPFGEICGYVCPKSACIGNCVLNGKGDPVKVGNVERAVFASRPFQAERISNVLSGAKIAVVGGGVAGLTFAVTTYRHGADVTVFEKDELLATVKSIPSFRLPREAVERVERAVCDKVKVVRQFVTAEDIVRLSENYDAVYVATGLSVPYGLRIYGEELAMPYKDCLGGKAFGKTIVIGGGNTALDCARLARMQGCDVTVAYRRTENDMPAFRKEIEEAKSMDVEFAFNVAPVSLAKQDGRLCLTLAKTLSDGRGKLTVTDDKFNILCDCVVSAIGAKFDSSVLPDASCGRLRNNVYIGGDANGGSLVAEAVADALKCAQVVIGAYKN